MSGMRRLKRWLVDGREALLARPVAGRWAVGLAVAVLLAVGMGAAAARSSGAGGATSGADEASVLPAADAEGVSVRSGDPAVAGDGPAGSDGAGERASGGAVPSADAGAPVGEAEPEPVDWASPSEPSPVAAVPAEDRVPKPAAVRGIYVGAWTVGNASRFERLIELADETEVNAFVIDVKDVTGEVSHASRVPLARQVGATERTKIPDLRGKLARLREHGIYPIARIVVFKDPLLATARPEWAIQRKDGSIWEDNNGVRWVDSYNRNVWDYNIELAREAIALGFSEIQWDYVRFADVPASYMVEAVYPAREGRAKVDGIREFLIHARDRLADVDVPLTADVFGITTSTSRDIGIGQVWEKMSDVTDVLLPMVYPSHYPKGSWNYANPNGAPYQIVKKAMDHGVARSRKIENAAGIRPWLQAFNMGTPDYGPEHIRAQIDAVYDAGLTEWILWSPSVRYPKEAFATASGKEPWFAGRGASLYQPAPGDGEADKDAAEGDREGKGAGSSGPLGKPVGESSSW